MEKKKIIIIVAVVVILLIIGILGFGFMKGNSSNNNNVTQNNSNNNVQTNENNNTENDKINLIENINKDVIEIAEFELRDVVLEYNEGATDFSAKVHNNSENDYKDGIKMLISFYDENNSLIFEAPMITGTIMAGQDTNISTRITLDCSNAKNIELEVIK